MGRQIARERDTRLQRNAPIAEFGWVPTSSTARPVLHSRGRHRCAGIGTERREHAQCDEKEEQGQPYRCCFGQGNGQRHGATFTGHHGAPSGRRGASQAQRTPAQSWSRGHNQIIEPPQARAQTRGVHAKTRGQTNDAHQPRF